MAILNPLSTSNAAIRIDSSNKFVVTATGGMSMVSSGGTDCTFEGGGNAYFKAQGVATVQSIADDINLVGRDVKLFATAQILLAPTSSLIIYGTPSIQVNQFATTGAVVSNSSGVLTDANASTAGFVLTSNGSSTPPSFQAVPSSSPTWNNVTGTSATMTAGQGYIANNASLVTLTLPATAAVGTVLYIQGFGAGGWRIAQGASQQVFVGSVSTTVGATGTTSSANRYDSMTLVCVTADTTWCALGAPQSAGLDLL